MGLGWGNCMVGQLGRTGKEHACDLGLSRRPLALWGFWASNYDSVFSYVKRNHITCLAGFV